MGSSPTWGAIYPLSSSIAECDLVTVETVERNHPGGPFMTDSSNTTEQRAVSRGNWEAAVPQKLYGSLDSFRTVSQVALGLASLDWDGNVRFCLS